MFLMLREYAEYKLKITYRKKISGLLENFENKIIDYEEPPDSGILLRDARQIVENFRSDNAAQNIEIRKCEVLIGTVWHEFTEKDWRENPTQKRHPPENYR